MGYEQKSLKNQYRDDTYRNSFYLDHLVVLNSSYNLCKLRIDV
jgi:hypothetical protein